MNAMRVCLKACTEKSSHNTESDIREMSLLHFFLVQSERAREKNVFSLHVLFLLPFATRESLSLDSYEVDVRACVCVCAHV
jgi:hypothetical protein